MSNAASFAATPRSEMVAISVANANRDGTGTIVSGFTSGASGSRVDRIEIKATGATTAGMVRAFKKEGAGAWMLWREYGVDPILPGANTLTFSKLEDAIGEVLEAGFQIGFATNNGEGFVVHVGAGDF